MDWLKSAAATVSDHATNVVGDQMGKLNIGGRFNTMFAADSHSHTHLGHDCSGKHPEEHVKNRYHSFVPESNGRAKWYVDGATYFWALSQAIEQAQESIYILDWWLSPEIYLRRPVARNEEYRLDNMLKAAAERGVKIKIIIYKEVEAVLALKSVHTKHALEALHPNIGVFRHPDHTPTGYDLGKEFTGAFNHLKTFDLATASGAAVKSLYGTSDGIVLFWAHHEKLCAIDGKVAFMGGLDACFGRYDTNSHPIADTHPGKNDEIIFAGQDYNNARVFDFANVDNWDQNQLDRNKSCRMGWADVALSMSGPIVDSLTTHFVDRWNFIHREKYRAKDGAKYPLLTALGHETSNQEEAPHDNTGDEAGMFDHLQNKLHHAKHRVMGQGGDQGHGAPPEGNNLGIQLTRSACKWSGGHQTEHSIANAYLDIIAKAEHFIYIENQFFITATSDSQKPVVNKLGAAMVERIVRAHEEDKEFKIIVIMPAVPAFPGDLHAEDALGTRAIMEFQYNSINRGGHSIFEALRARGVNDIGRYINFYNLRNYDRINRGGDAPDDSVAHCTTLGAPDIREMEWNGSKAEEIGSFVSEELYIHSKLLIADDRIVVCGSANLNDRSQLGDHDSEIAVVIEDPQSDMIDSTMNNEPYRVGRFASSLRRFLFRKHLGLIPHQAPDQPNGNWTPVTAGLNEYDFGSHADNSVKDPLSPEFWELWRGTASVNTEVFTKVFHNVPNDVVRTWDDYKEFFSSKFIVPGAPKKEGESDEGKVLYGHVVRDEFPGGADECKDWLSRVKGTLVEMPLQFLIDVDDLAKEGMSFNSLTDEVYT